MMVDIIVPIVSTANGKGAVKDGFTTIHFARPYDLKAGSIGDRLRAIQPSLFLGVPRVWEKIQAKLLAVSAANPMTGLKLKIKDWAKASALHNARNSQIGGTGEYPPNQCCGLLGHDFFDKKVLRTVKQRLGLPFPNLPYYVERRRLDDDAGALMLRTLLLLLLMSRWTTAASSR